MILIGLEVVLVYVKASLKLQGKVMVNGGSVLYTNIIDGAARIVDISAKIHKIEIKKTKAQRNGSKKSWKMSFSVREVKKKHVQPCGCCTFD